MTAAPASAPAPPAPGAWSCRSIEETAAALSTDPLAGLSAGEAQGRLERLGRNELTAKGGRHWLRMLGDQFADVTVWVLLAAVLLSALLGDTLDALVIVAILILNAVLGVVQESKAEQSLAALKQLAAPLARVVRDGLPAAIPSPELVPGDVVLLEAGNLVPADLRLTEAVNLRVDEASLTGESGPVGKHPEVLLEADAPLSERTNAAFAGTTVVAGRGRGIVVGTARETEIGQIARLLGEVSREKTPLQERLEGLGRSLAVAVLAICVLVFAAGWLRGLSLVPLFLTAVSLAVAAVPEGLPAVVTIVLALGVRRMVRRHAIVRRLRAVEALGSTTVICTDKTGTLTQNEMTVRRFWAGGASGSVTGSGYAPAGELVPDEGAPADHESLQLLLRIAALCNDATLTRREGEWRVTGDPTEAALLAAAAKAGLWKEELEQEMPRRLEVAFDSDRKLMSTLHPLPDGDRGARFRLMVKGAPGEVLARSAALCCGGETRPLSEEERERLLRANAGMAARALRVLGFAYRDLAAEPGEPDTDALERDLVFVGLLGMIDPPREEALEAVRRCREAGIRPVMITGDNPDTAAAIARELEILEPGQDTLGGRELAALTDAQLRARAEHVSVYARVSPADKLRIIEAYQSRGEIVAMTGDGVNDGPALKRADIGVAMGRSGTDVAKGAADIVLTDDNFASIVAAVEEGRGIFDNIRKFVFYLLSCNTSEVLVLFLAVAAGLPQPLLPVQLLWVNLVTDGLPALALGVEPKEPGLMRRPPRDPQQGVITRETVRDILLCALAITLATLGAYAWGLYWNCLAPAGYTGAGALTAAFRPEVWNAPGLQEGLAEARTLAFFTLAASQLVHALNSRSETLSVFRLGLGSNPQLLGAICLSLVAQLGVIYFPPANALFNTTPLPLPALGVGALLSLSLIVFGEFVKEWRRRRAAPA